MKYIYTDFGSLPVSFGLTMNEIDKLLELIEESDHFKSQWFLSSLKKVLLDSRQHTADLMDSYAKEIRDKDDV